MGLRFQGKVENFETRDEFEGNWKKILKIQIESIIKYYQLYVRYVHVQYSVFSLESLSKRLFTIQSKLHKNISLFPSPIAIVFYFSSYVLETITNNFTCLYTRVKLYQTVYNIAIHSFHINVQKLERKQLIQKIFFHALISISIIKRHIWKFDGNGNCKLSESEVHLSSKQLLHRLLRQFACV